MRIKIEAERFLFVSPPSQRPHGFWYISGIRGCGVGVTFLDALSRYFKNDWRDTEYYSPV